jgi:hypothetical protein
MTAVGGMTAVPKPDAGELAEQLLGEVTRTYR